VKLTAKVKLLATPFQMNALQETLRRINACCDWISERAWAAKTFRTFDLHRLCYHQAKKEFGLTAQVLVRAIAKVADAYKLDRRAKRKFSSVGAVAYDDRILKWYIDKGLVNIWTTSGRLKIPFTGGPRQIVLLKSRQGQSDLILHKGNFYLAATCNVETPDPADVDDFLGCDFGIVNIATDSDGNIHAGATLNGLRCRHRRLRAKLQRKQTRAAKRRLRKLSGKESRFARHVNHCISKQIVSLAERTGRGIAVENLNGIRDRIRARRAQRAMLHSWGFAQLLAFLKYKSALAGVLLVTVDPRNSSRECSQCGHTEKGNRPTQSQFRCRACGFTLHADHNAALNLRERGRAAVNQPRANWPNLTGCAVVSHRSVKSRLL
jgi:IS605 OrfB family transposase